MSAPTVRYRVSRALTFDELQVIVGNVRRATTTGHLVTGIVPPAPTPVASPRPNRPRLPNSPV
ncbi:MAG: hypothetical protein JXA67_19210 [Micromonosporaceae bacterium]|nr:hypothetical protein [Micromonosporaceae bacterium]